MKILFVSGYDDYMALHFEEEYDPQEYAKEMDVGEIREYKVEGDFTHVKVELLEFGNVDKSFIEFIRNHIQDYDDTKHTQFWIIEE